MGLRSRLAIIASLASGAGCMGPPPRFEGEVGRGANLWPICEIAYDAKGRETDVLWPLLALHNKVDHKLYALRPLFIIDTDPESRVTRADFLFPIFHIGKTGTRKEYALRPLLGIWRDPAGEMTDIDFLFPFGYFRSEPGKSWFQLRPLVWFKEKETEGSGYFHLFPLYGKNWDGQGRRFWLLTPLITYWRDGTTLSPDWTFDALWPLYHFEKKVDRSRSWAFPLFYRDESPASRTIGVTPFYWDFAAWSDADRKTVESRTLLIPPLFGRHRGARSWLWVGPDILLMERGKDDGSVNVLWPLVHHGWEPERTSTWVFPFYWNFTGPEGSVLVIPPFLRSRSAGGELLFLWPAFGFRQKDDYREYSTAYPFFWYGTDGLGTLDLTLFGPLFHHSAAPDGSWAWDYLFPLGNTSRSGCETHSRLFPLYLWWKDPAADSSSFHFLWPFFSASSKGDTQRSVNLFAPLVAYSRAGSRTHSRFFPFYLHWKDDAEKSEYLHVLWPLVRRREVGDEISFRLLLPYITYREKGEEHDFRVFWKWIRSSREKDFFTLRINPFYRRDENAKGDLYWSVLGGLVSRKRLGEETSWKVFWVIPI